MDGYPSQEHLCICGRGFPKLSALTNHKRTCGQTKKRLFDALLGAKEAWTQKKRPRQEAQESAPQSKMPPDPSLPAVSAELSSPLGRTVVSNIYLILKLLLIQGVTERHRHNCCHHNFPVKKTLTFQLLSGNLKERSENLNVSLTS